MPDIPELTASLTPPLSPPSGALLSPHFKVAELSCKCCGLLRLDYALICGLELLRERVNSPLIINSGYRCSVHNLKVGGSRESQHTYGRAADVRYWDPMYLYECAERVWYFAQGGIGLSLESAFVHVDVRRNGPARWGYKDDKVVPIEQVLGHAWRPML